MKRQTRLYNVIFPIWMLYLFPQVWLIVLPGNLVIDCAVLLIALAALKHTDKRGVVKGLWWKLWLLGFAADLVGAAALMPVFLPELLGADGSFLTLWTDTVGHVMHDPFAHPAAFTWMLAAVALSGACIYFFDRRAMGKCGLLTDRQRHIIALALAVATAPWTFFIPMY